MGVKRCLKSSIISIIVAPSYWLPLNKEYGRGYPLRKRVDQVLFVILHILPSLENPVRIIRLSGMYQSKVASRRKTSDLSCRQTFSVP